MNRREIRLCGFGGQGIITAGHILGKAAALFDDRHVTFIKSYGPESRGGACSAQVIIADNPIDFPRMTSPEMLVAMSQEAYEKYVGEVQRAGTVLVDSDLVDTSGVREDLTVRAVPAQRTAEQVLGKKIVANIVMLGFVAANTDAVTKDALLEAVLSTVPEAFADLNRDAFQRGFEHGAPTSDTNGSLEGSSDGATGNEAGVGEAAQGATGEG